MEDENAEVPTEATEPAAANPEPPEQPSESQPPEAPPDAEATVTTEEPTPEETKHEETPPEETQIPKPEESPQEEPKPEEGPSVAEESSPEKEPDDAEVPPTQETVPTQKSKETVEEKREATVDQPAETPSITEAEKRPSAIQTTDAAEAIEKQSEVSIKASRASLMDKTTSFLDKKSSVGLKTSRLSIESTGKKVRSDKQMESRVSSRDVRRTSRIGSKAQRVLGSTIDIRRMSTIGEYLDKSKAARYMNTYKLDSDKPFNPDKVQKILELVMTEAFENLTYDTEKCPKQAKWASSAIRARVKELQFDRYKIVCVVTIGEKTSQDVLVTCRFLWDVDRDRYAFYFIENTYVFGIAMCFGLYYE